MCWCGVSPSFGVLSRMTRTTRKSFKLSPSGDTAWLLLFSLNDISASVDVFEALETGALVRSGVGWKVGVGTAIVFVLVTLLQADAWRRAVAKSKEPVIHSLVFEWGVAEVHSVVQGLEFVRASPPEGVRSLPYPDSVLGPGSWGVCAVQRAAERSIVSDACRPRAIAVTSQKPTCTKTSRY